MLEFLAGGDAAGADFRAAAAHVARAICRLALTGNETAAALQAVLLEDADREVRGGLSRSAASPPRHHVSPAEYTSPSDDDGGDTKWVTCRFSVCQLDETCGMIRS